MVLLILVLTAVSVSCQIDCPMFNETDLGTTDMSSATGLVGSAFQAVSGDPSLPVSVQVHDSNIVCLRSGRTRDTYSGVSVVVNYTCTGAPSQCSGNPILSQIVFCTKTTTTKKNVSPSVQSSDCDCYQLLWSSLSLLSSTG